MRLITGVLACVGTGWFSLALADPPAATPALSTASPSAAHSPAPTSPASAAAAAVPAKLDIDADEQALRSQGFKPEMVRGQKLFCRNEQKLGSHFEQKRCGTVEQLKALTRAARELTENGQRLQTNPPGH